VVSRALLKLLAVAACLWLQAITPAHASGACDNLWPSPSRDRTPTRLITPTDLARIRQIGQPATMFGGPPALTASPDGRSIAFVIARGDPQANSTCTGLAVLDVASGRARLLDRGGEIILGFNEYRGRIWGIGFPALMKPLWSPDGKKIAYLRRNSGTTQVWVVDARTGEARQVTKARVDVEHFAWLPDSSGLAFSVRIGRLAERQAFAAEALRGFHYDDRFVPMYASTPLPDATIPLSPFVTDLGGGPTRSASPQEAASLPPDDLGQFLPPARARNREGWIAQSLPKTADPFGPVDLRVTSPEGKSTRCAAPACQGRLTDLWWIPGRSTLLFLRREGWANGYSALYRWRPGQNRPRRLLRTVGLIDDCTPAGTRLVCLAEAATKPAQITSVDPATGRQAVLFDPNPDFAQIRFGRVERLEWKNAFGLEVRGDLALPPGYRSGERLPLIVTTYTSHGFLQGATGDEFPIHAFAARGFAVLSFNRPAPVSTIAGQAKDYDATRKADLQGWTERRSVNSAVLAGVQRTIDLGIADPQRIGITGLSDGATIVAFALINSNRFAAAAMSSCCLEPWSIGATVGPAFARLMHGDGWPLATADDRTFWSQGSVIQNAARIDTPLLLQEADREYLMALDSVAALKEHGKPVDMYVFPDEYHNKWQPAHRLAVYERHIDWFAFWLQGKIDADPSKVEQYARWRQLREDRRYSTHVQPCAVSQASTSASCNIRR